MTVAPTICEGRHAGWRVAPVHASGNPHARQPGPCSNGLQFRKLDLRIRCSELLLPERLEVEGALVFVRIAVHRAEVELALALEAREPNLPVARPATARVELHLLGRLIRWLICHQAHRSGGSRSGQCRRVSRGSH